MSKILCSVEILTRNSEQTLERCLESVKDFDDIIILDGNSTDKTLEIARRFGARIFKQYETDGPLIRIADFSEVRNKGLGLAKYDWFMFIDSDEYLSSEVVEEIRGIVASSNSTACAFWQPRKYVLDGQVIDCATTYPNRQIRLFQRSAALGFIKPIHERIDLKPGSVVGILQNFEYVPVGVLRELDEKWRRYRDQEILRYKEASAIKLFRLFFRQTGILGLYFFRYIRIFLFCRGKRLPFAYEFTRHKHTAVYIANLFFLFLRRMFS